MLFIPEGDLYALLFAMQLQKANNGGLSDAYPIEIQERIDMLRKFKRWMTAEVLGYQLLRKTTIQSAIQEAIEQRQQRTEVTQDYVIQKLKEITK